MIFKQLLCLPKIEFSIYALVKSKSYTHKEKVIFKEITSSLKEKSMSSDEMKDMINKLFELVVELNDDLNDREKVVDWLTFISCPRIHPSETSNFCMTEFLQNNLSLLKIQQIIDLTDDLRARIDT